MTFNGAQVHLLINHFPVVGFPLAILAAAHGRFRKQASVTLYSYYLTIFIWVTTVVSYLTGDPAEEVLHNGAEFAVQRSFIQVHERTAKIALILASVAALTAILSLPEVSRTSVRLRETQTQKSLGVIYAITLLAATVCLAFVAHQGGLIRHLELR